MKKILLILATSIFLFSCSNGPGPKQTAKKFAEGLAHGKYEEIKPLATKPLWEFIELTSQIIEFPVHPEYEFRFIKETIDGDTASILYYNVEGEKATIDLIKTDGAWLVIK